MALHSQALGWPQLILEKAAASSHSRLSHRCSFTGQEACGNNPKIYETRGNTTTRFQEETDEGRLGWMARKTWKGLRYKSGYSQRLTSILVELRKLPDSSWVDRTLDPWMGMLEPREHSVLLSEERSWSRGLAILSWLKRQRDYRPNVIHYNIVLKLLSRAQKFELLLELWEEMEKEVVPSNVSYGTMVDAYSKAGEEEAALRWLQAMKLKGFKLDGVPKNLQNVVSEGELSSGFSETVETCNALISVYGSVGRFADASRVFSEMIKAGIVPDLVTFNSMIEVCGSAGNVDEAEAIYHSMEASEISPDVSTFNVLISVLAKKGRLRRSLKYFSKMKQISLVPDRKTFHTLLTELAVRDMVTEAEAVAQEMKDLGIPAGQTGLTEMYERLGFLEKASEVSKS